MKIGFIGDTHQNLASARFMLWAMWKQGITHVVQVGDFGIYSTNEGMKFASKVNESAKNFGITLVVVPGNHENWRIINELHEGDRENFAYYRSHIALAPRGKRWEWGGMSFVALGGAPSVDRNWRAAADKKHAERGKFQANQYWYREEQITQEDVEYVVAGGYADVMVGHDAPYGSLTIASKIRGNPHGFHPMDIQYAHDGRLLMTEAFAGVKPRFFFHGHYHFPVNETIYHTRDEDSENCHLIGLDCEFNNYSMAVLDTGLGEATNLDHTTLLFQYRKDNFKWPSSSSTLTV